MTGCSMTAKRMGNDLITGKQKIGDISNSMKTATTSTKALGVAMNVFANVGFMLAITAISKVVYELAQAQENAVQAAKEATEAYNDEISSIDDYKTRLSELHKELNSGNLSYEETKAKRTELMSIQDELIEKFGTEKSAIESVTEAINGQVDALNTLSEKSYRDWVAKADEQTFWNQLLPGGKSGLDQAIDYMETDQTVSFSDMQNANLSEELQAIQKEIDETIKSKYNLDKTFAMFNVTGRPDEIKEQLDNILQDYMDLSKVVFTEKGIDSSLWDDYRKEVVDSINKAKNEVDKGLNDHQETYQTYIEGLIKYDSEYSDEYANILQKRAKLESAQNSGNKEEIQKARQAFMDAINKGIEESGSNENIRKYFESLYPELQAEFSDWAFEFDLQANVKGLKDVANEIGEQYTAVDLLDMVNTEGIQEGEESFNTLIDKAYEYGVITDKSAQEVQKLIDLLVALGYVKDNVKSDTFNNEITVSSPTSFLDKLSTEDYEDISDELTKLAKAGELTPYTLSSTAEYNKLLTETDTTAEQAYSMIMKLARESMGLSDWQTTLDNSRKNVLALKEMKKSLKDDGVSSVADDVVSNYPELIGCLEDETSLREGINGLISDYQSKANEAYFYLVQDSESYYASIKANEAEKLDTVSKNINAIVNANKTLVEQLGGDYNIDLKNFKSIADAKAKLEQELIKKSAKAWATYYKVQVDANTGLASVSTKKNADFYSGGTGGSDSIKKYEEISKQQNAAREAVNAYNQAFEALQKITDIDIISPTENSTNSSNNTKNEKKTTKTKKQIDWITISLNNLSRTLEKLQTKLENTSSWDKQLKIQDKIIKKQKILTNAYKKSANAYEKTYLKALNKLGKNKNEYKTKIESGEEFSVETFKKEKVYNKVAKAQEAYENWQNALSDYQEENYNLSQAKLDKIQIKADKKAEEIGYLEAKLENANGYKEQNRIIDKLIDKQKKYYELQIKLAKTEKERKKLQEEYASLVSGYLDTEFQNIQAEYDRKTGGQQTVQQRIQDKINLATAQGKIIGNAYYKGLMSSAQAEINYYQDLKNKMIEFRNEAVKLGEVEVGSEEWYNMSKSIAECDSQMDNLKASTEEWNTAMQEIDTSVFDDLIAKFQKLNDEADFYIKLLENSGDMFDENGNMTDLGNAKLGMLYTKHQVSQNEGEVAGKEAEYYSSFLDEAEKNGKVVINGVEWTLKELEEKISSLKKTQQDAILSTIDYMEEIYSFIEEGINAEIEAYEELIEKKKEALEADEELYEFQKKLKESSQDIALIERQLAALEGDDSDEARKKRRELEAQKAEAEESHQELIKEQAITMQSENLDNLLKQFEADKKTYLESVKTDLSAISEKVNTNLPAISGTLDKVLAALGYDATDTNTDIKSILDSKKGTVAENVDNVTNGYVDESKEEKENANNEAQKVVTEVQQQTQDVVAENVLFEENDSIRTQIDDIIKSGTKTKKSEADDKKANGEYKYRDVNRYLIKKYGYRINQKKQTEIARLLGMTGATEDNITNIKKQIKLLEKLQVTGFSSGGLVKVDDLNSIVRANGDDGLATVKKDEYVLTPVQSQSFLDFAKISPDLLKASNTLIDGLKLNPVLPTNIIGNAQPQNIDASVNIQVQGNADATTVKDIRKIAEDVVAKQQKEIQRQAYNRGMRLR